MPAAELSDNPAAAFERERDPEKERRTGLMVWRIGAALCLVALGYLWIRSWHRIDHGFIPIGSGGIELCLAGSSFAVSILASEEPTIQFGNAGPIDAEHLIHFRAQWPDGDSLGRAANPCVFAPQVDTVTQIDFDRLGSFGAMLRNLPTPAGPAFFSHLRLPLWFPVVVVIAGWFWIERYARLSRRSVQS